MMFPNDKKPSSTENTQGSYDDNENDRDDKTCDDTNSIYNNKISRERRRIIIVNNF